MRSVLQKFPLPCEISFWSPEQKRRDKSETPENARGYTVGKIGWKNAKGNYGKEDKKEVQRKIIQREINIYRKRNKQKVEREKYTK